MTDQEQKEYKKLKAQKEKQLKRQNEYMKNNYDRIALLLPKGSREKLTKKAAAAGFKTITEYIRNLIEQDALSDVLPFD